MTDNTSIRILIADDHPIFRDGLRRLLESEPGFEVIGEASDGDEAVAMARSLTPDVMLLDLSMPRLTGLGALKELGDSAASTKCILLTAAIDKPELVTAIQLGAKGVVLKQSATDLLFKSIRCVMDGQFWVGREAVANILTTLRTLVTESEQDAKSKTFGLTKRELEVVGAIVEGLTNKEIAKRFTLSEDTVKHHLTNVFNKLGVSTRLEVAMFAVHHKLIATI